MPADVSNLAPGAAGGSLPPPPYKFVSAAAPPTPDAKVAQYAPKVPPPPATMAGAPVDEWGVSAMAPAAPNPSQIPVPTNKNLGLPEAPNYDTVMNVIHGPIAPAKQFSEDWNSPQAMKAVKEFEWALMANFTGAAAQGGAGLSLFFQSNPHAYMLGMSTDRMADVLRAQAISKGATDSEAEAYGGMTNVMNTAMLMQGMANEAAGKPFGFTKEKENWLKGTWAPHLDNMPARGRNLNMSQGAGILPHITQVMNNMVNDKSAQAAFDNSVVNRDTLKQKVREYDEGGKEQTLAQTKLIGAQVDQLMANRNLINEQVKWYGKTAQSEIGYKAAATQYQQAQNSGYMQSLRIQQMEATEKMASNNLAVLEMANNASVQDMNVTSQQILALGPKGYRTSTQADVDAGKAQAPGLTIPTEDRLALEKALQEKQQYREEIVKEINRNKDLYVSKMKDTGSPEFHTLSISPLLKVAAARGQYDLRTLFADIQKDSDVPTRNLFFPKDPQAWDPKNDYFRAVSLPAAQILPIGVTDKIIEGTVNSPELMEQLRQGKVMTPDEWERYRAQSKAGGVEFGQGTYIHYVHLMNYLKQTDFLLHTYQKAVSAGIPVNEVPGESLDDTNPLHVPTIEETAPQGQARPRSKPTQTWQKGWKK